MIAYFRHQVSNNHHLMARSYGRGEGSSAYGPKMHESLPYPRMGSFTVGRMVQCPAIGPVFILRI